MKQSIGWFALMTLLVLPAAAGAMQDLDFNTVIPGYYLSSGQGIVADAQGNSYVYAKHYPDGHTLDILVAKLGPDGSRLWTVPLTGSGHDWGTGIILDGNGDVLMTGWTASHDFPVTADALDTTLTGFRDVFLIRLSAEDGSLLYGTFLGGDYTDEGRDIALDPDGNILIAGATWSTDFPVLDPIQAEPNGYPYQTSDLFLTRIAADGSALLQSTYLGGAKDDSLEGMAVDGRGRIWLAGFTHSADLPLVDPLQDQMHTGGDPFVQSIDAGMTAIVFGTYLGGEDDDSIAAVAVGPGGDLYLTGTTQSEDFPTTAGSFAPTFVGGVNACETYFGGYENCEDMWAARITPAGAMAWSSFLGGTRSEVCSDLAVDAAGRAWLVGWTGSSDFPPDGGISGASIVLMRMSPLGDELEYRVAQPSGSANAGHGVALDGKGGVYITGAINVPADVFVAKLSPAQIAATPWLPVVNRPRIAAVAPNPFNPHTVIAFDLPEAGPASLEIFDARGRLVRTLVDGDAEQGRTEILWDGRDRGGRQVASGVYHARLQAAGQDDVRRMVLIR